MHATALKLIGFVVMLTMAGTALATDSGAPDQVTVWEAEKGTIFNAADVELDAFKWRARPIVIFADSENDPAFQRQIELFRGYFFASA